MSPSAPVTRLRDVELTLLEKEAMASCRYPKEDESELLRLESSIQEKLSELCSSTTAILTVATTWLHCEEGDGGNMTIDDGEETETEDEMKDTNYQTDEQKSDNCDEVLVKMEILSEEQKPIGENADQNFEERAEFDAVVGNKEQFLMGRIKSMKKWENISDLLECPELRRSLQSGVCTEERAVAFAIDVGHAVSDALQRPPNSNSRLWIERIVAACQNIVEIANATVLLQAFDPVRDSTVQMQQYCCKFYPDYVQDMVNDVDTIELLQQQNDMDSSTLGGWIRLLLDQLRLECDDYSCRQSTTTDSGIWTDEQYRQANLSVYLQVGHEGRSE